MHWSDYFFFVEKIGSRYFIVAAIAFVFFYWLLKSRISYKKIQQRFPRLKDYAREIGYSVCTIAIFGFVPLLLIKNPYVVPHTLYYTAISDYGWWYFFAAFPLMLLLHDTYFYWTHRLMHHKKLFRLVSPGAPSFYQSFALGRLCFSSAGSHVVEAGIFAVFLVYHTRSSPAFLYFLFSS